jgi:CheY-like chemotaxis protein
MASILVVDDSPVDRRLIEGLLSVQPHWTVHSSGNGAEALTRMQDAVPDVVVTDLLMPEMDGLQLVEAIHAQHPEVPVVLITAYGSEALAVRALTQGAASYVPKSQLADKLADVVAEVLALAGAERHTEDLFACLSGATFQLKNDPALIDPLVELVQQMGVGVGFGNFTERLQVAAALREALVNALYRGNLEISFEQMQAAREDLVLGKDFSLVAQRRKEPPYRDRRIFVQVNVSPDEVRFVVRDEGLGFDVAAVPEPGDPRALEPERGRGLSLMRNFMDEVIYNDVGNEVILVRRKPPEDANPHREDI